MGQAFRGYEIEVKTPIYKIFKSGPERLNGREKKPKKTGPPAETNDPVK